MDSSLEPLRFGNPIPIEFSGAYHDDGEQEEYRECAEQQGVVLREHEKIQQRIADSRERPVTIPAATVAFDIGSTITKLPVMRLRRYWSTNNGE